MQFNPLGFTLAAAMTRDLEDRARATQISVLGGMLGPSPVGGLLLGVAARDEGLGPGPAPTPSGELPAAPQSAQVPEVHGELEEAEEAIESRGLVPAKASVASQEALDVVIGSAPEAGAIVPMGSTVTILLSGGLEVPEVVGKKLEDARSILKSAGFKDVEGSEAESDQKERVSKQEPEAGEFEDAAEPVKLYLTSRRRKPSSAEEPSAE